MKIEEIDTDIASFTYEVIDGTIPITYIVNYLEKDSDFTGKYKIDKEEKIKTVNYEDAIYKIDEDSFVLSLLRLTEYNIVIVIKNASSKDAKRIGEIILNKIPKPILNKLTIEEFYRTTVRIKTDFKISNLIKNKCNNEFNNIKEAFPKFKDTEGEIQIIGLHLRILPKIEGDYASRVAKGLEPIFNYMLDFHFATSSDYEKNILTVSADLEDTKIGKILQNI